MANDSFYRNVQVIGEQDGPVEQELKQKLVPLLEGEPTVERAYLCRANYEGDASVNVVLLLRTTEQVPELRKRINSVFAGIFANGQTMDISYLTPATEVPVARICQPFFKRR